MSKIEFSMTEQELKEKIVKIIKQNGVYNGKSMHRDYYVVNGEELADALIAANIGDVHEWKHRAQMAENGLKNCLHECNPNPICPVENCKYVKCGSEKCKKILFNYYSS